MAKKRKKKRKGASKRKGKKKRPSARKRNKAGAYASKRKTSKKMAKRGKKGQYIKGKSKKRGKRQYSHPGRALAAKRRNPTAKVAFGLPRGLAKLPLVGDVFLEENLFTGAGIGIGFGFIPMIEERVYGMLGLDGAAWYADPSSWQRRALDTLGPVAVGGIGFAVSRAVKSGAIRKIGKGFAMAGIGYGVGRLIADFVYPMLPPEAQPTVSIPRAGGVADYLPYREGAGSFLTERGGAADGVGDYLPYREGAGSFLVDRGGAAESDEQIYN